MKLLKKFSKEHLRLLRGVYLLGAFFLLSCHALVASSQTSTPPANTRVIKGTVKDASGEPLASATVAHVKSKVYAISNVDGEYKITIPNDEDVELQFSFVGMETLKHTFKKNGGNAVYNAVLKEDKALMLDEVVVTGIYNRSAGSFTGASSSITSEQIERTGNQNVIQSLKTIDPTVQIATNLLQGSDPNTMPDLSLRGTSSLPLTEGGEFRSQYRISPISHSSSWMALRHRLLQSWTWI